MENKSTFGNNSFPIRPPEESAVLPPAESGLAAADASPDRRHSPDRRGADTIWHPSPAFPGLCTDPLRGSTAVMSSWDFSTGLMDERDAF